MARRSDVGAGLVAAVLVVVAAACTGDDAPPQAAGGRTCGGWVTVDAVEAAIGRPLGEVEVDNLPVAGGDDVRCEIFDGDERLLALESKIFAGREVQEFEILLEDPEVVEGPIEGSAIGPMYGGAGGQVLGLAPLDPIEAGAGRMLDVALHRPGPDVDGYEAVARLLEELEASVTDGPPGNV